jgi:hypothetical protein
MVAKEPILPSIRNLELLFYFIFEMFNDDGKNNFISLVEELSYFLFFLIKKKNVRGILKFHGIGGTLPPSTSSFMFFILFSKKIKKICKGSQNSQTMVAKFPLLPSLQK